MNDNLVILYNFVLSYYVEPNKKVYFISCSNKLYCTCIINYASFFCDRECALLQQKQIKDMFGLDFQIEKVGV